MRTGILRALLGWLAHAFASAKPLNPHELPEALRPRLQPAWRHRQLLGPQFRTIVPSWFASQVMDQDRKRRGAGDIGARIDKAVRNAVAVGFRRYNRLSAVARG